MRRLISVFGSTALVLGLVACVGSGPGSGPAAALTTQWAAHGGDHSEQRHSPLDQINATNVQRLGVAWYAEIPERGGYQGTPLVVDGKLIVTTPWSKVYAFDAKSGKQLWKYDPKVPREVVAGVVCCNVANRGAAYWNGKIIWGTLDGRLVAVDINDGKKIWESLTVDRTKALSITGAPRIGNGIVFIGQGGSEYLQRGYLSGWDAETGKKLWHWWAVPGNPADGFADQPEMEWAAKTWKGEWWKNGGGGTPWDGIIYDPQTDLVIMGTGNGSPWPAGTRSPGGGDNLFTASIVALHAKTGRYAWHYQATPMDSWDYDNTSPFTIADLTIGGQKKHVVMQAPKNGLLYVIEVGTGKVLSADLIVPGANWLTGFDEKNNWKPILNPHADPGRTMQGWTVTPLQAHLWYPQAFNPQTGLIYVPTRWGLLAVVAQPDLTKSKQGITQGGQPEFAPPNLGNNPTEFLQAWDPVKRKAAWKSTEGSGRNGVLSTAGNLLFQGKDTNLLAFRADTGEKLWTFPLGATVGAAFITYSIDGVQYLAGAGGVGSNAGGRVFVLKLSGNVQVPPATPVPQPVLNPPPNFGDAAMLARGNEKYNQHCTICHEARLNIGRFPDLKMSPYLNSDALFRAVVLDGALEDAGMLPFKKTLSPEEAEAIRAHIVSLANTQKAGGSGGGGPVAGGAGGRAGGAPGAGAPRGGGPRAGGAGGVDTRPAQPGGGMGIYAEGGGAQNGAPVGEEQTMELHQ